MLIANHLATDVIQLEGYNFGSTRSAFSTRLWIDNRYLVSECVSFVFCLRLVHDGLMCGGLCVCFSWSV